MTRSLEFSGPQYPPAMLVAQWALLCMLIFFVAWLPSWWPIILLTLMLSLWPEAFFSRSEWRLVIREGSIEVEGVFGWLTLGRRRIELGAPLECYWRDPSFGTLVIGYRIGTLGIRTRGGQVVEIPGAVCPPPQFEDIGTAIRASVIRAGSAAHPLGSSHPVLGGEPPAFTETPPSRRKPDSDDAGTT